MLSKTLRTIAPVGCLYGYFEYYKPYRLKKNVHKVINSTYGIKVTNKETQKVHRGTGFLISPDKLLTNDHILFPNQNKLLIRDKNMDEVEGKIIKRIKNKDLALIQLNTKKEDYLKLSKSRPCLNLL